MTAALAGYQALGSGVTGLLSAYSAYRAGNLQSKQFKMQSRFLDLQRSQEALKARENAVFLRENFSKNISSAKASFVGRGIALGSGTVAQFGINARRTLAEDLQANELNSDAAQNALTLQKSQVNLEAGTAKNLGLLRASQSFSRSGQSLLTGLNLISGAK